MGQSLTQNRTFDRICLHNLRLWQLIVMCDLTRKTASLVPKLKVPLETTQLILVHNESLSIRFRQDEKQFDVDGAYNVRYEIVKKRIDKALIKGTEERLTQPGKIAIVYTHDEVAVEYHRYIEFLQQKGYLEKHVKDVVLEPLQGVEGLKALRVSVKNLKTDKSAGVKMEEIMEVINPSN